MKRCLLCKIQYENICDKCPDCNSAVPVIEGFEAYAPNLALNSPGFKPEYFRDLVMLEATNFWFRARNELIRWALGTYQPDAKTFFEVGCGTGFVLSGIAEAHPDIELHGSEIFLAGLSYAADRVPTAHLMQMDARDVPFKDEFDAIGAFDVLEHIEEDETVLVQLHEALKPGGVLLLTVPQHPWLWSASDDYACHVRRYSARELREKLVGSGFRIERSTSFVSLLLPAMLFSRLKKNHTNIENDPAAELRLPTLLNILFLGVMRFEQILIRLGVCFPLGGSRLIVARKTEK